MTTHSPRNKAIPVLAVGAAILAGCAVTEPEVTSTGFAPNAYRHLAIDQVQHRHDVAFGAEADRPSPEERRRLSEFLSRLEVRPGDPVLVMAGGSGSETDARRRDFVAAFLSARRLRVVEVLTDFGRDRPPENRVRLFLRRHVVTVRNCPDFTKEPRHNFENTVHSNFGCAVETNLGLMVARPGDLVRGRPPEPMDGTVAAGAIERYRLGQTKPLLDSQSGQIEIDVSGPGAGGAE